MDKFDELELLIKKFTRTLPTDKKSNPDKLAVVQLYDEIKKPNLTA